MLRRGLAGFAFVTAVALASFVGSAGASHAGAIANCGTAGTFTVKAAPNGAGFQSPTPDTAVVFEEGAVLTVQQFSVNGVLVFTRATNGAQHNDVTEVTCTFTSGAGDTFVVTGVLGGA